MDITHVVGTRFNLGKGTNADWTTYRGRWLRQFAAESVKMQTLKPALWVVLVDPRTPKEIIDPILADMPCEAFNMEIMYPPKNTGWARPLASWLRERVKTKWMTFTRLDSDDALHPLYLHDINKAVQPRQEILSFRGGYVLRLKQMETYKLMKNNTNFQTTVERTATALTGYCAAHGKLRTIYPLRVLQQFPRWLVVRHEQNERRTGKYPFPEVPRKSLDVHFGWLNFR